MKRWLVALAMVGAPGAAAAQSTAEGERFFVDKMDVEEASRTTLFQGSLTSTTVLHRETAGLAEPLTGGVAGAENASPISRMFTDLRAQMDARHIKGSGWEARIDTRLRLVADPDQRTQGTLDIPTRSQSGLFGRNEYEIRELYLARGGKRADFYLGRQQILDVAAVKVDGLRIDYASDPKLTYLVFGGLYPQRGSRSVTTDYPKAAPGLDEGRVMPIIGGAGAAYRTPNAYGGLGAAAILPLGDDQTVAEAVPEQTRVFVTSNGYWRRGPRLDVYHYLVVDVLGAAGLSVTNGSLGVNWKPSQRLRVTAAMHRVDTETLTVQAQNYLQRPEATETGIIRNDVEVQRIASDSARVGISAALGAVQRFEVSVQGAVRQREEIVLTRGLPDVAGGLVDDVTLPQARSGEVTFQVVDRRSLAGLRLAGSVSHFFGIGDANYNKSKTTAVRLAATRELASGRGEWEVETGYAQTKDDNRGVTCDLGDFASCYGSATARTMSAGGTFFYRLRADWWAVGTLWLASQKLAVTDLTMTAEQPAIVMTTGMARIAYRF